MTKGSVCCIPRIHKDLKDLQKHFIVLQFLMNLIKNILKNDPRKTKHPYDTSIPAL